MNLKNLFTEYDDNIAGDINLDPLGLLTIWSAFGQKIFRNRISSISNDVRSYTLNLFHHHVIRRMVSDESIMLSPALMKAYSTKESLAFKQVCLIHLENLFVFSHLQNADEAWVPRAVTGGIFGISKARRRWKVGDGDTPLKFSKDDQLLVRQLLLGVSGRYKTPMVEMGFFDRLYHDGGARATSLWQEAQAFIGAQAPLKKLETSLLAHFKQLLAHEGKTPSLLFSEVDTALKRGYVTAFASPGSVGSYARDYWLRVTDLDRGAAGAILSVLNDDIEQGNEVSASGVFPRALALCQEAGQQADRLQLEHVLAVEPFLTDLDLLFTLMLSKQSQSIDDIVTAWRRYKRDDATLARRAAILKTDTVLCAALAGTALIRLKRLIKLDAGGNMHEQIALLLDYHKNVMAARGQTSWLATDGEGRVKVFVPRPAAPAVERRTGTYWANQYYIPQFANLARGFKGTQS
ncbi:hypothetical protein [Polaromonas hydrogenivorans]|uniref:Zorya protein ZorC EH domain-containing protein n=1 Tax=Polaromonas hydrogenivorans TaxID=335476 RepID=A0AAU7M073_9BURK